MTKTSIIWAGLLLVVGLSGPPTLAQNTPLASAQFSADPDLRCDILEVKRVSGGALIVTWRMVNTAGSAGGLTATAAKKNQLPLQLEPALLHRSGGKQEVPISD